MRAGDVACVVLAREVGPAVEALLAELLTRSARAVVVDSAESALAELIAADRGRAHGLLLVLEASPGGAADAADQELVRTVRAVLPRVVLRACDGEGLRDLAAEQPAGGPQGPGSDATGPARSAVSDPNGLDEAERALLRTLWHEDEDDAVGDRLGWRAGGVEP